MVSCVDILGKFEQLFKLLDDIILVTDNLVEGFDVTFLMFRQLGVIGMVIYERVDSPMGVATLTTAFSKKS